MKIVKTLLSVITIIFAGLGLFKVLPFDPDSLKGLTREAFWKYTYEAGHSLDPPHATLLVNAMIEEQLLQSTKNGYTNRTTFKQELDLSKDAQKYGGK